MKKLLIISILLMGIISQQAKAQKIGYADSEYILSKMPEYKGFQEELAKLTANWKKEVQSLFTDVERMYDALKAEEALLTREMYDERSAAIKKKEEEAVAYQDKIFGTDGLYFLKQKELMQPILAKLGEAIDRVSKKQRLGMLVDKAGLPLLWTDPRHDYSDFVLEELGIETIEN